MKKKMSKKNVQAILLTLFVVGMFIVSPIAAKNPDEARIKLIFKQGPWDDDGIGWNDGRWQATGAFNDGGLVHDDYLFVDGMSSHYTMTGRNGDLIIDVDLDPFEWVGPSTIKFEGEWQVAGGTGDYAGASGSGTATQIIVLAAAMHSGEFMVGGPAVSNHVVLNGAIYFP